MTSVWHLLFAIDIEFRLVGRRLSCDATHNKNEEEKHTSLAGRPRCDRTARWTTKGKGEGMSVSHDRLRTSAARFQDPITFSWNDSLQTVKSIELMN